MKSNELRIGNIVAAINILSKVESLNSHVAKLRFNGGLGGDFNSDFIGGGGKYEYNKINPVTLTEKWLVRFGFGENGETPGRIQLDTDFGQAIFYVKDYGSPRIKYVHQLQNIYFALTGEELLIK